jgi:4-amino-4-deoxy-L-arabinose transferase-like glycosyltransferase
MQSWLEKFASRPQRAILLLSLVLLLAGNWLLPLTDRDETRFAEASREMLQRSDFVVPWFNGQWRFDKPVLIYWCQMASYQVFGENPFGARLPSVLFTVGTALIIVRWGRKVTTPKNAFLAGAFFVAGLHVAIIGRVATADMAMVFFSTLAVYSGWQLTRPDQTQRRLWWWLFYVTLAFGFLAKGPVAWLPIGGMILGRFFRKADFRLPLVETVFGLLLATALAACWGIPALLQTNGEYFNVGMGEHVLRRSTGIIDGHGLKGALGFIATFPLYFLTFFISFLPWSIKVPTALQRWWPQRRQDILGWYLMMQALLVFLVFSCVRTKLPHYTMPAFPCIALWLALQLGQQENSFAWSGRCLKIMYAVILAVTLIGFPIFTRYLLTEDLWTQLRPQITPETKIACFGYTEPSLVWKFRGITTNLVRLEDEKGIPVLARQFLTNPPPLILILPTKDLAQLPDTNGLQFSAHGLDMVKFKNWNLTAIVRTANH